MPTMYDSTTPWVIPTDAPIVAGYIDGRYAWDAEDWQRLGASVHVTITVFGNAGARVFDCENGYAAPITAAWCRGEQAAGRRPTVYADRSTWPQVRSVLGPLDAQAVDWWAADPTGVPHLVPGSVATQYAWNALHQTGGLNVDLSVTDGTWPGSIVPVPPAPPPAPPPKPSTVAVVHCPLGGYWEVHSDGGVFSYGRAAFYGSLGGKVLTAPITAACGTTTGRGYYLAGADGAIYAFGDAIYFGGSNT